MATKANRDLEAELGPSPHPAFADREEPWKDHELMLKLEQQHDYQYEIAHVLGASPSQISYWMDKAHENWSPDLADNEFECTYFDVCGNEAPGPDSLCNTCTDIVRHNDKQPERDQIEIDDYDNLNDYIEALYDEYEQFETNKP